jgi:hypothetical protein
MSARKALALRKLRRTGWIFAAPVGIPLGIGFLPFSAELFGTTTLELIRLFFVVAVAIYAVVLTPQYLEYYRAKKEVSAKRNQKREQRKMRRQGDMIMLDKELEKELPPHKHYMLGAIALLIFAGFAFCLGLFDYYSYGIFSFYIVGVGAITTVVGIWIIIYNRYPSRF